MFTQRQDDQFDWTTHKGSTPSRDTGPDWDHTLKNQNGFLWTTAKQGALAEMDATKTFQDGVNAAFKHIGEMYDRINTAEREAEEEFAALMLLRKANRET